MRAKCDSEKKFDQHTSTIACMLEDMSVAGSARRVFMNRAALGCLQVGVGLRLEDVAGAAEVNLLLVLASGDLRLLLLHGEKIDETSVMNARTISSAQAVTILQDPW